MTENNKPCKDRCKIKQRCSLEGVRPATLALPYPDLKVMERNRCYADILSHDFAGKVSEFSAITQYVNHEIRMTPVFCKASRVLLAISQAEMIHLNKIGELIILLGGESCSELKFNTCCNMHEIPWTPNYINYEYSVKDMLLADLDGEFAAIAQYKSHIGQINDSCIQANLERIIQDEMYHTRLIKELLKELDRD